MGSKNPRIIPVNLKFIAKWNTIGSRKPIFANNSCKKNGNIRLLTKKRSKYFLHSCTVTSVA